MCVVLGFPYTLRIACCLGTSSGAGKANTAVKGANGLRGPSDANPGIRDSRLALRSVSWIICLREHALVWADVVVLQLALRCACLINWYKPYISVFQ